MQKSALCRSRRELSNIDPNSNEYLLAKIGVDTAENEPLARSMGGKFNSIFIRLLTRRAPSAPVAEAEPRGLLEARQRGRAAEPRRADRAGVVV